MKKLFLLAINIALLAAALISGALVFFMLLSAMLVGLAFFLIRQKLSGKPVGRFSYHRYTHSESTPKPGVPGTVIDVEYQEVETRLE